MKETAVDWLFLMLNNPNDNQKFSNKLLEKAKEIETRQKDEFATAFLKFVLKDDLTEDESKYLLMKFKKI